MIRRVTLAIALLTVLLAAEAAFAANVLKVAPDSELARRIVLQRVGRERLRQVISATATIEPDADAVAHITTRIPGRVVRVIAQLGQRVKAGQPLALLNSRELGKAKTDYLKSKSLREIARKHLEREESLYAKKIAPEKDVLAARAQYETARAEYEAAWEALRLLIPPEQVRTVGWNRKGPPLSEFALISPIGGTLVERDITVGSMLDPNDEPMTVIDLDKVWVIASVFEHDLADLRLGASASIKVDALPNRNFDGKVTYISDTVDRKTRTVQARIEVPNSEHLLKLGMFAHARILSTPGLREVLCVPEQSVFEVSGKKIVFVALGDGRYEPRVVQLGQAGVDVIEVEAGLQPGEQVVTRGGLVLKAMMLGHEE